MLFLFTNDTFSIIDALMKLILVITCSALIICFCHKLTSYKKSRRYKSSSLVAGNHFGAGHLARLNGNQATIRATSTSNPILTSQHLLAYDPYHTIGPFNCLTAADSAGLHLGPQLTSAYGYQSSFGLAAIEGLALGSRPLETQATNLVSNPVYSTTLNADCSSFRARQIGCERQQDACPSYAEAIASIEPPSDQQAQLGQAARQECNPGQVEQAPPHGAHDGQAQAVGAASS